MCTKRRQSLNYHTRAEKAEPTGCYNSSVLLWVRCVMVVMTLCDHYDMLCIVHIVHMYWGYTMLKWFVEYGCLWSCGNNYSTIGVKLVMMHLLTKLFNFAISKNSFTKIQKLEHKQRKIRHVFWDIINIPYTQKVFISTNFR